MGIKKFFFYKNFIIFYQKNNFFIKNANKKIILPRKWRFFCQKRNFFSKNWHLTQKKPQNPSNFHEKSALGIHISICRRFFRNISSVDAPERRLVPGEKYLAGVDGWKKRRRLVDTRDYTYRWHWCIAERVFDRVVENKPQAPVIDAPFRSYT